MRGFSVSTGLTQYIVLIIYITKIMSGRFHYFILAFSLIFCVSDAYAQIHTGSDTSSRQNLNPIVVTGSGHHQRLKKTASPVRVLPALEIRQQGITNLQDALMRMLPQVQTTPSSMGNFLRLNGLGKRKKGYRRYGRQCGSGADRPFTGQKD